MSITADSSIVMDLIHNRVNGKEGLGIYQLYITFNYVLKAWQEKSFTARNGRLFVHLKDKERRDHYIGAALPQKPFIYRTPEKSDINSQLTFILDLTGRQLELIEAKRNGKDLQFETTLQCEVDCHTYANDNHFITSSESRQRVYVNQSEWLKALKQMGYGEYLLFEILLPESSSDAPDKILNHLSSAKDHFIKGHYDVAINKCRFIFDRLNDFRGDSRKLGEAIDLLCGGSKKSMTKSDRTYFIRYAVHHYTHLAHHPEDDEDGNVISFTRQEAKLILTQTAALVSYYFEETKNK